MLFIVVIGGITTQYDLMRRDERDARYLVQTERAIKLDQKKWDLADLSAETDNRSSYF